jgi:transcriptional regulator with XRE-family HTH domain
MSDNSREFHESLCQRFLLVQEISGLSKTGFAKVVGMSPQQLSNVQSYRTAPSHVSIMLACENFGVSADWFYFGRVTASNRNPKINNRLITTAGAASPQAA